MANGIGLPAGEVVEAFKALASPLRWQILEWLRDPEGQFAQSKPIADLCGASCPAPPTRGAAP